MQNIKYSISLVILLFSTNLLCQRPQFSIGIMYQPSIYWSYNKLDWNNWYEGGLDSYPVKPGGFNGIAFGMEMEKKISKLFNLKAEIAYSDQIQRHRATNYSGANYTNKYNIKISTQFKYFKVPIMLSHYKKIKNLKGVFLSGYLGPQISVLTDYKFIKRYSDITVINGEVTFDLNNPITISIITPNSKELHRYDTSSDEWTTTHINIIGVLNIVDMCLV